MPDSPKCEECVKNGKLGQTYKVAGKPLFRCQNCNSLHHRDSFDPEAFLWRSQPARYKEWRERKQLKKIKEKKPRIKNVA